MGHGEHFQRSSVFDFSTKMEGMRQAWLERMDGSSFNNGRRHIKDRAGLEGGGGEGRTYGPLSFSCMTDISTIPRGNSRLDFKFHIFTFLNLSLLGRGGNQLSTAVQEQRDDFFDIRTGDLDTRKKQ
jgi:hypothetical protein